MASVNIGSETEQIECKEPRDRDEMMKFLGIKHRTTFRSDYLNPLLDDGKIAMTIPEKPRS